MDHTLCNATTKGKNETKLVLKPTNNLEREFFNSLFAQGAAKIVTVSNSDEIVITTAEDVIIPAETS